MRQVTRKGLMIVAAATGAIAATGGYASADSGAQGSASSSPGVLSGNSVQVPVHAPVNVCGNTVNVLGVLNPSVGNKCAQGSGGSGGGSQAGGRASDSPGVGSGNQVQVPVHAPVNVCGNTVNVVGIGNPATGNDCAQRSGGSGGGSQAGGRASDSPGVGSGNQVQVPVHAPVNVCGNTVNVIGIGNPATGNGCTNDPSGGDRTIPPGQPGNPGQPGTPGDPGQPGDPGAPGDPEEAGGDSRENTPDTQSVTGPKAAAQLADTGSELPLGLALPVGAGAILGGALLYRKARATS